MNSVLNLRLASCSPPLIRLDSNKSISSIKIRDGAADFAILKSVLTIFSPSPCHLDVSVDGEQANNGHWDSCATALTSIIGNYPVGVGVCAMANGNNGSSNVANQWVNYFTHTGHLRIEGLKMSKSLKNFITIRQALEQNSSRLLRLLFLLAGGWDQPMNYSQQTMEDARSKETTFKSFFRQVEALSRSNWVVVCSR